MSIISRQDAVQTLLTKIPQLSADELAEVYNEIFPDHPTTEDKVGGNAEAIARQVISHMTNGLEVEEIIDLWNLLFPECRTIWYDENAALLHIDEESSSELSEAETALGDL